jgi:hypothetical protein
MMRQLLRKAGRILPPLRRFHDFALRAESGRQIALAEVATLEARLEIEFPTAFVGETDALHARFAPFWSHPALAGANHKGGTFFCTIAGSGANSPHDGLGATGRLTRTRVPHLLANTGRASA